MISRAAARAVRHYNINWVIKILIISDFLVWSAMQLFGPIFAIYITTTLKGGIEAVGFASAIFLISKSLFEVPVGVFIDKKKGEKDDLYSAIIGTFITAITFAVYTVITEVWQLYLIQALQGIGAAIAFPGWYSIFTKHIDHGKEGFEWSLYDVLLGFGMAATAALGGLIAEMFGFDFLYFMATILTLLGTFALISIRNQINSK